MSARWFPDYVTLNFDPALPMTDDMVVVFANPLALKIWLAYSSRHLRSQYTAGHCVQLARAIEKTPPADFMALKRLAARSGDGGGGSWQPWGASDDFWSDIMGVIRGTRHVGYRVKAVESWSAW